MEYYNYQNKEYLKALENPMRVIKIKLEMLDNFDNAIGCIEDYMSNTEGSISVNLQQGCRRSCNISIIDKDEKFLPSKNSLFWYNRRFKIYIGLKTPSENVYWFSQGVFLTKNVSSNGRKLTIDGIDKYGLLNGELNVNACDAEIQMGTSYETSKKGSLVVNVIRQALGMDMGNNNCVDSTEPLIDANFYNSTLYSDIVLEEGNFIGDLFDKLADMFNAYIYYDNDGRLRMESIFDADKPYWYSHLAPVYNFGNVQISDDALSIANSFNGINTITVATDNTEGFVYSYTAQNTNPLSPVNINAIGVRRYQEGTYNIPLCDTVNGEAIEPYELCRQTAECMLIQNACENLSINFSFPIIPHINVDNAIELNNEYFGFQFQKFLVQSMEIPLNGEPVQYSVTNIQWLPFDSMRFDKQRTYDEILLGIYKSRNDKTMTALSKFSIFNKEGNLLNIKSVSTTYTIYNDTETETTSATNDKIEDIIDYKNSDTNIRIKYGTETVKVVIKFKLETPSTLGFYEFITSSYDGKYDPKEWALVARNSIFDVDSNGEEIWYQLDEHSATNNSLVNVPNERNKEIYIAIN